MNPIIIVGSGLAGYNVARELRKLNKEIPLTVISSDSGHFYSKPMLSNALASKKAPEAIPMNTPEQMATQLNATVRPRTWVSTIVPERHEVEIVTESGTARGTEKLAYSRLVLATGAAQIRLPLAGNAADKVFTVNDLDDYASFRNAILDKKNITIIGAGLIGSEFANDLAASGHHVEVIDIADRPLGRLLPPEGGALVQQKLAALGVVWHFSTGVKSIDQSTVLKVTLDNGTVLDTDVVLSAIGLQPRIELARAAGISCNRGIIVNRRLETSAPDVYALGDCAEVEGLVLPYVMPIMHAARALAATLAGKETPVSYPAMPVLVKTPACPTIVSPPAANAQGTWQIEQTADGVKALFVDGSGKLLGFALNGTATAERAKLALQLPPVLS